ncbi:hypothetical protein HW532_15655 [Kaustia mangrovi]|uniref:Uncharacterized protein n=1 Tax=Kaustia mangrovi TaxID=2593653 RepID=A0A7S8C5X6_9HYPH|nr:hypothetical protein [Kaustia mangrovi]QPC43998.1 hypothetical protein HW532_15655 [Kaustia mangrovi]
MAWTQEEYEALKKAVASGVLTVKYADRTVTYQNLKEMRDLLGEMRRSLSGRPSYTLATTRKGV